jgi:hypothetical protein
MVRPGDIQALSILSAGILCPDGEEGDAALAIGY